MPPPHPINPGPMTYKKRNIKRQTKTSSDRTWKLLSSSRGRTYYIAIISVHRPSAVPVLHDPRLEYVTPCW